MPHIYQGVVYLYPLPIMMPIKASELIQQTVGRISFVIHSRVLPECEDAFSSYFHPFHIALAVQTIHL